MKKNYFTLTRYQEVDGDLLKLTLNNKFDVVGHGCNCKSTMGAGIAPQFAQTFGADKFPMENPEIDDLVKLGSVDWKYLVKYDVVVCNIYSQLYPGSGMKKGEIPLDYEALTLALRKINYLFQNRVIGLPKIGCGLAEGSWLRVRSIIQQELSDMYVVVVNYKPE